jgi:hypothetical protein
MKRLKNWFICWWSTWYFDIHSERDDIRGIPDQWKEYRCKRCGKNYKLRL